MTVIPMRPPGFDRALVEALPRIRRNAAAWIPDHTWEVDDLLQEAALQALENPHRYDPGKRMDPWLVGILNNVRLWVWRKARRSLTESFDGLIEVESSISGGQEAAADLGVFLDATAGLPEMQRVTVVMVELLGMTEREAAEILDISQQAVSKRLGKARRNTNEIRKELA